MGKICVISSIQNGGPVWDTGGKWSSERPDAFEFQTFKEASDTLNLWQHKKPKDQTVAMAVIVVEDKEDANA